jgi:hypothetical protein
VYGTGWTVAVALLAAFGIAVTAQIDPIAII